jgi:hypothetical protein
MCGSVGLVALCLLPSNTTAHNFCGSVLMYTPKDQNHTLV